MRDLRPYLLPLLLVVPFHVQADDIFTIAPYVAADLCIKDCVKWHINSNPIVAGCGAAATAASCFCAVHDHSTAMNRDLSECAVEFCASTVVSAVATARGIFTQYCGLNGFGGGAVEAPASTFQPPQPSPSLVTVRETLVSTAQPKITPTPSSQDRVTLIQVKTVAVVTSLSGQRITTIIEESVATSADSAAEETSLSSEQSTEKSTLLSGTRIATEAAPSTSDLPAAQSQPENSGGLTSGQKAGIATGVVLGTILIALLALIAYFMHRRAYASLSDRHEAHELPFKAVQQKVVDLPPELHGKSARVHRSELPS